MSKLKVLCRSTSNTAKNGIGCLIVVPNQSVRRKKVQHSQVTRLPDGAERKPDTESGTQAPPRYKRAGVGARHDRGDVGVGLLRESGERPLHTDGLRRSDQLLHQG